MLELFAYISFDITKACCINKSNFFVTLVYDIVNLATKVNNNVKSSNEVASAYNNLKAVNLGA